MEKVFSDLCSEDENIQMENISYDRYDCVSSGFFAYIFIHFVLDLASQSSMLGLYTVDQKQDCFPLS